MPRRLFRVSRAWRTIKLCRANVGMPRELLHLLHLCDMFKGIGDGGLSASVNGDAEAA
jgi:hypothetical protein